jgi:hypothetical protein
MHENFFKRWFFNGNVGYLPFSDAAHNVVDITFKEEAYC